MSRNDPERALLALADYGEGPEYKRLIREIRATERRLTVERIRNSLDHLPYWDKRSVPGGLHVNRNAIRSILDDLATAAVDEEE